MVFGGTRRLVFGGLLGLSTALTVTTVSSAASAERERKKPAPAAGKDPAPTGAASANRTRAADLFKKSSDAYLHGDFATAIKLLDEAYAIDPQPVLVYNMARAHEGLGHVDEAVRLYERYLSEDPNSSDRGAIEQRLATLHRQQEERKRLEKEKADVETQRAQQQQQQQAIEQRERETRNAPPPEPPRERSVLPYVVAGVGAAGVATGAVFGFLALDKEDAGTRAASLKDAIEARDTGKTFATLSNVSFIMGGLLVAGGAVWWVLDGKASNQRRGMTSPPPAITPTVHLGVGPSSVSLRGVF